MKRSMAGEIAAAGAPWVDRNAYVGRGRSRISPFEHVTDYVG